MLGFFLITSGIARRMKKVERLNHTGCFGIREDLHCKRECLTVRPDEIKDTCPGKRKGDKHCHLEKVMSAGRGDLGHIR